MREKELADLLMRIATERGLDVERAADELAVIAFPSFVDERAFRSAVVDQLEAHLRAQMEMRLQSIRRRFDTTSPEPARATAKSAPVVESPVGQVNLPAADGMNPPDDNATMAEAVPAEDELPTDATMVWTTRHG
jgi:hypothetical protein